MEKFKISQRGIEVSVYNGKKRRTKTYEVFEVTIAVELSSEDVRILTLSDIQKFMNKHKAKFKGTPGIEEYLKVAPIEKISKRPLYLLSEEHYAPIKNISVNVPSFNVTFVTNFHKEMIGQQFKVQNALFSKFDKKQVFLLFKTKPKETPM